MPHSPISGPPEIETGGGRHRENERVKDTSTERQSQSNAYKHNHHPPRSDNYSVVPASDIVRVEGWWKVRGRERWRMVGGRDYYEEEDEKETEYEY